MGFSNFIFNLVENWLAFAVFNQSKYWIVSIVHTNLKNIIAFDPQTKSVGNYSYNGKIILTILLLSSRLD